MENNFFSATKEKLYITFSFVALRWLLGYLNHINLAAKVPFFVNMFLAAVDLVVSLPLKIVFATPSVKSFFVSQVGVVFFFALLIGYWYLFACILMHAYRQLNRQDAELSSVGVEHSNNTETVSNQENNEEVNVKFKF